MEDREKTRGIKSQDGKVSVKLSLLLLHQPGATLSATSTCFSTLAKRERNLLGKTLAIKAFCFKL